MDVDIVNATIEHLAPVVSDMVRTQLLLGCRPQDVCRLTPGSIDRSGDVWVATPEEHKTSHLGRERRIYIGPQAQEVMRPYLLRDAEAGDFSRRSRPATAR